MDLTGFIKRHEGFSDRPYLCPAGYTTIGWGHLIRRDEHIDSPISSEDAERLLAQDIDQARMAVLRLVQWPLSDNQQGALVSFTFNLGAGALQRSTLRRKLNRGEVAAVPDELRRWVYAGGRKLPGLMIRREAEVRLFMA
ncbi:glycoside hydrolase family protein [bacterium]|nr:glycoside hydrolase family protein [bacterium]